MRECEWRAGSEKDAEPEASLARAQGITVSRGWGVGLGGGKPARMGRWEARLGLPRLQRKGAGSWWRERAVALDMGSGRLSSVRGGGRRGTGIEQGSGGCGWRNCLGAWSD